MPSEIVPEYKMPYEDRVREEAWSIESSRKIYEESGRRWEPWMLNVVSINIADILSGKRPDLEINIPSEESYSWAEQKVESKIRYSKYKAARLRKVPLMYCPIFPNPTWAHPGIVELYTSWNGMRNSLSVGEFFFLEGIPEEELKSVFHYDPENLPPEVRYRDDGFFGFVEEGKQKLADLVKKPIAFVYKRTEGINAHSWNLKSREVFSPI